MKDFNYSIPTKVYFGKGKIKNIASAIKKYGNKVLVISGRKCIKETGIYDHVIKILNSNNISYVEFEGIEPNPKIEIVREGIRTSRSSNIDVILAVGGGSVIDCAKIIAAGIKYDGDPWELVISPEKINDVLPIVTVLTIAGSGSEMNAYAVISDISTNQKLGTGHEKLKPKVSILDPEYTYSVPKRETAAGVADIMSHVFESYFNHSKAVDIQDSISEGLLRTCIKYGKIAIEEPANYDARANLMWASSLAINGIVSYGTKSPWVIHPMEHELSGFYNIIHGEGMAILIPHWMKYSLNDNTVSKFAQYGINVWNINKSLDKYEIAYKAIEKTSQYFRELGLPSTLREVGIEEDNFEIMAEKAIHSYFKYAFMPLDKNDLVNIYKLAL